MIHDWGLLNPISQVPADAGLAAASGRRTEDGDFDSYAPVDRLTMQTGPLPGGASRMTPQNDDSRTADRFRVLFEHSSDAHFIFDETGITDCNAATIELLKATDKAQVLALHPAVLSPEYQPDGRRSLEKSKEMDGIATARGYHRFEWLHRKLDGEVFPVEVTLNAVEAATDLAALE